MQKRFLGPSAGFAAYYAKVIVEVPARQLPGSKSLGVTMFRPLQGPPAVYKRGGAPVLAAAIRFAAPHPQEKYRIYKIPTHPYLHNLHARFLHLPAASLHSL